MTNVTDEMVRVAVKANLHPDAEPSDAELQKMRAALIAALAKQWQPIESAPKDGTRILAFDPDGLHGPVCAVVYWERHESSHYEEAGDGLFRKVTDELVWWEGAGYMPFRATHWMPLPAPPSMKKEG